MPGKWGGAHRACPPRSANELGCQANGGARTGRAPPRSANEKAKFTELPAPCKLRISI